MSFIHTPNDVITFFESIDIMIKEDAVETFLNYIKNVKVDEETLQSIAEAFVINNKVKEFNYKITLNLIDYIKQKVQTDDSKELKRSHEEMLAPSTPLKNRQQTPVSLSTTMMTPVSGHVYTVSDSPSKRHNQSPKTWPTPTKSEVFSSRKERNTIKTSFDNVDTTLCDDVANFAETIDYEILPSVGEQNEESRYITPVEDKEILRSSIIAAREMMSEKYQKEFTNISYETEREVAICGKVYFDIHSSTILKDSSIFLYDENESKVALILSELPSFTVFPGQVIGVEGMMNNRRIQVSKIYPGYPIETPQVELQNIQEESYSIVIVRGPYSSRDDDSYEQLQTFVEVMNETLPQLIIMCGPFVPESCCNVLQFSTSFDTKVLNLIKELKSPVLLVPALEDVSTIPVFPQTPYLLKNRGAKIHSCGNPSMIEINHNLSIGIVNADILKDLMVNSYRKQDKSIDNQTLFCLQLLEQKSLYPLYPVTTMALDPSRLQLLTMPTLPDIQIVATDKMKFIKEVNGVLFISPGPLALGNGGGTYVRLSVYPFKKEVIEAMKEKGELKTFNNVAKRSKAQLMIL